MTNYSGVPGGMTSAETLFLGSLLIEGGGEFMGVRFTNARSENVFTRAKRVEMEEPEEEQKRREQ